MPRHTQTILPAQFVGAILHTKYHDVHVRKGHLSDLSEQKADKSLSLSSEPGAAMTVLEERRWNWHTVPQRHWRIGCNPVLATPSFGDVLHRSPTRRNGPMPRGCSEAIRAHLEEKIHEQK